METLDRLVWAKEIGISVLGVPIGLRANIETALDQAIDQLPQGRLFALRRSGRTYSIIGSPPSRRSNHRGFHFLFSEAGCVARSTTWGDIWQALKSDVSTYVALTTQEWLFIRAGVVGWKGYAIILPGNSSCGKTTLVKELIQRGASYYSDEFAVLDRKGFVHPFAGRVSVGCGINSTSTRITAESLAGEVGSMPLRVKLIIATRYEKAGCWRPEAVSPGNGLLLLLSHTLAARNRPVVVLDILHRAISGAQVLRSSRGDAEEVVQAILGQ